MAYWILVASALVPALHCVPGPPEYIARSTTLCAGVAPIDSTRRRLRRVSRSWMGGGV